MAAKKKIEKQSEAQAAGLQGPIKQVMQVCYRGHRKDGEVVAGKVEISSHPQKNFIDTYTKEGTRTARQEFSKNFITTDTYNKEGLKDGSHQLRADGSLYQDTKITYDKDGKLLEYLTTNAEGEMQSKHVHSYNEEGKKVEDILYLKSEDNIRSRSVWNYNDDGNLLSHYKYDAEGAVQYQTINTFDERGLLIEAVSEYTDDAMNAYNSRTTHAYNEQGDMVETIGYLHDGSVKYSYTSSHQYNNKGQCIETINYNKDGSPGKPIAHEYDKAGKRLPHKHPPYDPHALAEGETEKVEEDKQGNWIKKTISYNELPVHILAREITYHGKKEKELVHPLVELLATKSDEVDDPSERPEELTDEQAKWLADDVTTADKFPFMRYYTLMNNEVPSAITYTGPNIEAFALLDELKDSLQAQEVHSYGTVWENNGDQISRYTLTFPRNKGYMLVALGIGSHWAAEYEVPSNMKNYDEGYLHFSQFQLLRPSDAGGNRDEYFEAQLEECIRRCSLNKKPDKPVINMIEVSGGNFAMHEHAVDDDFEIKDLDINYGYGFEKFHTQLMKRFNSSKKGLVLFHGQPGTGKTYYIRHLLRKMMSNKKVVIYMPPNMVDHLVEPAFMTFLSGEIQRWSSSGFFCVLLIEDAEPLLAKRQEGVRIQGVTNLLNMTDGLLNDMLNLQIICTFNVDLRKLDSALLRPGRLIARKEFKALSEIDANVLGKRLGIDHHFKGKATLGEIYSLRKDQSTLIHDVDPDKDASDRTDDLF